MRITPAHAGKRQRFRQHISRAQDHPRTRGEKSSRDTVFSFRSGSPPHTRGKVSHDAIPQSKKRITPAHAGKRKMPELMDNAA